MKRTSRLTALILVLLMLVNISASATTTTGIPLSELDIYDFETMTVDAMSAAEDEGGPVLSEPCSEDNVYCGLVSELVALPTAQQRYDYMMNLYSEDETDTTLEGTMLHYYYYKTEHNAEGLICECDFPSLAPGYQPGALSVHEADCPWTFANLSVSEQYAVVKPLMLSARAPYIATLSAEQATALETYTAQQEAAQNTACTEQPEYCQFDVYSAYKASELYAYLSDIYAADSNLYTAMMEHYNANHQDSNLICACGEHPLEYPFADINRHAEECPWFFANLTMLEQYDVYCGLSAPDQVLYLTVLDSDQAEELVDYIYMMDENCDGSSENGCGFNDFVTMTGEEREEALLWLCQYSGYGEYGSFVYHAAEAHMDTADINTLICLCAEYEVTPETYHYGGLNHEDSCVQWGAHTEEMVPCPWHFKYLTSAEKADKFAAATTAERAQMMEYMTADEQNTCTVRLSQQQYNDLMAYLALKNDTSAEAQDKLDRVNKTEHTVTSPETEDAPATDVAISVPEGAFDVDYIMNAAASALNELQKKAMEAVQIWRQLAVFDISFEALSDGSKLQPNTNSPVQLTFTVDVSNVHGNKLHVHHLKQNEDGTYTAESLGTVDVDKTQTTQTITVACPSFSYIALSDKCDGSSCYEYNAGIVYNYQVLMAQPTAEERYEYLDGLYTKVLEVADSETAAAEQKAFVDHLKVAHSDCLSLICSCGIYPIPAVGDSRHAAECPWSEASQDNTFVVEGTVDFETFEYDTDMTIYVPADALASGYKVEAAPIMELENLPVNVNALNNTHNFAAFDVKFLTADGASVQIPAKPVTFTFNVQTYNILGSYLVVHGLYADENGNYTVTELGRDELNYDVSQVVRTTCSTFPSIITVSYACDGSVCGFNTIMNAATVADREAALRSLVENDMYFIFRDCANEFHYDETNSAGKTINDLICLCYGYPDDPEFYAYGTLNHDTECWKLGQNVDDDTTYPCPWHFNQIPVEDQLKVLASVEAAERGSYVETVDQTSDRYEYLTNAVAVMAKNGTTEDVLSWLLAADDAMMQRAANAATLDYVVLEDDQMIYVRNGLSVAYVIDVENGRRAIVEPSCDLTIAYIETDGTVTPVAEATAQN